MQNSDTAHLSFLSAINMLGNYFAWAGETTGPISDHKADYREIQYYHKITHI